jgi:hypothetical protein
MKELEYSKITKLLLAFNVFFWLIISFLQLGANLHNFIKTLLFLEVILYAISFYGVLMKIKVFYFLALILTLGNSILSVTDELDPSDIFSLAISLITFISLLSIWKKMLFRVKTT